MLSIKERLETIEFLAEINISCEPNLKDIKHHLNEIRKKLNLDKPMEKIEMIVKLTLSRLEIIKLKSANAGYEWSMVNKEGREQIEKTLIEIDEMLLQLKEK